MYGPKSDGLNATYVMAPTMISGAVSPTARESARIEPVAIPGIDAGSTCRHTTCHFVAPRANAPCLIESGTARMASREATTTVGSTTSVKMSPPASTTRPTPIPRTMNARPRIP